MKYFRITKNIFAGILLLSMFTLNACKEELKYDITGDTVNRVFVRTPTSYTNIYPFAVIHTPVSDLGTVLAKFPALSSQAAASDLKVSFEIDNSLISTYNSDHSTTYSQIPDSLITLVNTDLNIPKGKYESVDTMSVAISNNRLKYLSDAGYVLPIKITSITQAPNTAISSNLSVIYVVVTTSFSNCAPAPIATDMVGSLITNRTAWTATLDATLNSGTLSRMFDAKTTTYWFVSPAKEVNLVVNMGSPVSNITGIRIHSYSTSYSLTSAIVYTSVDGVTWVSQGLASLSTVDKYQYIKFYTPIPSAQYIKLDVKGWKSGSYVIMAEYDVYKN